uniref:Uncharacterized protein n=1 Tax=Cucumis melo TaxID=3656 RepID=A0A9I9DU51_CUCME
MIMGYETHLQICNQICNLTQEEKREWRVLNYLIFFSCLIICRC